MPCPACKATVPILDQRGATCPFCLQGVPVPSHPRAGSESHVRVKRMISSRLSQIRGLSVGRPIEQGALIMATVIPAALTFVAVPQRTLAALMAAVVATLLHAFATYFRGRHWRRAGAPPAEVAVDTELTCFCRLCSAEIATPAAVVKRCRQCRRDNLIPAPLVKPRAWPAYREMLLRRRQSGSPRKAERMAKTYQQESTGWLLMSLAGATVIGWFQAAHSSLAQTLPLLQEPTTRVGVPAFLVVLLGVFGLYDVLGSWVRRLELTRALRAAPGGRARRTDVRVARAVM
jgi:hypothetical protein